MYRAIFLLGLTASGLALAAHLAPARAQALAQTSADEVNPGAAASRLEDLGNALRRNQERAEKLKAEINEIAQDRARLNQHLLETARRIKESERQLEQAEIRLQRLADRRRIVKGSLVSRRKVLAELLAALQKLGHAPPPAIIVRPEDALSAIRSAMLLGQIVPGLRDEAKQLVADLQELSNLHDSIAAERKSLAEKTAALAQERQRIEMLIASKQSTLKAASLQFEQARARGEELARETASLKELIKKMDEAVGKLAGIGGEPPVAEVDPQQRRLAFSDPGRMRPAVSFVHAKGMLPLPVSGAVMQEFGESDGLGGSARGISIETRESAQVTSPCDGWVVYAGVFRSYGELLIINAGDGYHVLLAGLSRVNAQLGQFVLAGEPVGVMGAARPPGQIIPASEKAGRPVLYVEFRKDGVSIDPSPWWTSAEGEVRG